MAQIDSQSFNCVGGFKSIPLYQNGVCFGQKLVPNICAPNVHNWPPLTQNLVENETTEIKTEIVTNCVGGNTTETNDDDSEDDLPLTVSV